MEPLQEAIANLAAAIAAIVARLDAIEKDLKMIHQWASHAQGDIQSLKGRQNPSQDTALNFGSPGA